MKGIKGMNAGPTNWLGLCQSTKITGGKIMSSET